MTSLSVFDMLVMHDFVADLPSGWLRRLTVAGRPVSFAAGHRLCREDEYANRFWLLTSGEVAVDFAAPGRGDIVADHIGAGEPVGWSWMWPPFRWRFGSMVAEDVHAVEIDAVRMRELIAEDADIGR